MIEIAIKETKKVQVKSVFISAKCSDLCVTVLTGADDSDVFYHTGYVQEFIPGHFGDYVSIEIDIETGQILNWKKPTSAQIEKWIAEHE